MRHDMEHNNHMRIDFVPQNTDGECRCKNCKKLLAKIKDVDKSMVLEIKCTRAHCGLVNTFEVSRNTEYQVSKEHPDEFVGFSFRRRMG